MFRLKQELQLGLELELERELQPGLELELKQELQPGLELELERELQPELKLGLHRATTRNGTRARIPWSESLVRDSRRDSSQDFFNF